MKKLGRNPNKKNPAIAAEIAEWKRLSAGLSAVGAVNSDEKASDFRAALLKDTPEPHKSRLREMFFDLKLK